ncbi:hypothetical protein [Mesonia aquimarina]|uniref:hypothetical protein n=1 Tax=Mesonia aquimarina TaxID=1504967 RepID=UPI000EF58649|nr:hypothetical protein [Mesonia aquimarina]
MKYFIYFLILSAIGMLIYNSTLLDFNNLFGKESSIALACVLCSLCVIVLMLILLISREIKRKSEA